MRRDEVLAKLRAHEVELRASGAEALYLFGSVARDEAREDSDVDLLFDRPTARPFTLFDLIGLEERISEIMGCPVDLGTRAGLKTRVRERVEHDVIRIF